MASDPVGPTGQPTRQPTRPSSGERIDEGPDPGSRGCSGQVIFEQEPLGFWVRNLSRSQWEYWRDGELRIVVQVGGNRGLA